MRARRLLFPCASGVFLLAIPCVAFVFWTSQPPTVELTWMRWAFLASAALLLLMLRPTLGVVVIDERGVRVRTLFRSAFIPWQDVRQVGKHDGLVVIPKHPAQNIFISRVRQPWARDKYLPRLYRCFWRRKDGKYTRNVLNFKSAPALEAAIRHSWPGEWVYLLPETRFPARGEPQKIVVHKKEMSACDLPVRPAKKRRPRG